MSFRNRFIFLASIGFAVGIMLCTVITSVIATVNAADGNLYLCSHEFTAFIGDPLLAFVIQSLVCGIYGIISFGGTAVYGIEEWSILKATAVHFLVTVTSFYITAFFLRWLDPVFIKECLVMLLILVILYVLIWISQYLAYRSEIMEINKELNEMKAEE